MKLNTVIQKIWKYGFNTWERIIIKENKKQDSKLSVKLFISHRRKDKLLKQNSEIWV